MTKVNRSHGAPDAGPPRNQLETSDMSKSAAHSALTNTQQQWKVCNHPEMLKDHKITLVKAGGNPHNAGREVLKAERVGTTMMKKIYANNFNPKK